MFKKFVFCMQIAALAGAASMAHASEAAVEKPSPDAILDQLKAGNARFVAGKAEGPHRDAARLQLAGSESQAKHALATVLTCSDSRLPAELIFDAGIMDLFVIRVAGNVADTDEIGTIEYGVGHVHTPLVVVMGHTQCGAVDAVTRATKGEKLELERNIPPLVDNIAPAVQRAMATHKGAEHADLVLAAAEENVWQSVKDLLTRSASVREAAAEGHIKVVGAIYNVGTGEVRWLPMERAAEVLEEAEQDPARATKAMAGE